VVFIDISLPEIVGLMIKPQHTEDDSCFTFCASV